MTETLEPTLTKYDQRVLKALDQWTDDRDTHDQPLQWMTAWDVGLKLCDYDVPAIRAILRGLERLGYVTAMGWDSRSQRRYYIAAPWKRKAMLRDAKAMDATQ